MRRGRRRRPVFVVGLLSLLVLVAASASACVPVAGLTASPLIVKAGEELTLTGVRFAPSTVTIHLNTLDGPVLTTVDMPLTNLGIFKAKVTIPPGTPAGTVVLVATQDPPTVGLLAGPWGVPARTVVTLDGGAGVVTAPTAAPVPARPADLQRESVDMGSLVMLTFGVATACLVLVGGGALLAGRRGQAPMPARAPSAPSGVG